MSTSTAVRARTPERPKSNAATSPGKIAPAKAGNAGASGRADHEILFQEFFKSVGPRTYAAQVKRANNGNHYLILMEGKRDEKTDEIRKTRLFVFGEDFPAFFKLVHSAQEFIKAHPVPADVKKRRERFWSKQSPSPATGGKPAST